MQTIHHGNVSWLRKECQWIHHRQSWWCVIGVGWRSVTATTATIGIIGWIQWVVLVIKRIINHYIVVVVVVRGGWR